MLDVAIIDSTYSFYIRSVEVCFSVRYGYNKVNGILKKKKMKCSICFTAWINSRSAPRGLGRLVLVQ